jgi:gamma-glutamylputrescine oxidase
MSVGLWQTPHPAPAVELVDTVVIGAGLIGAYLALRLQANLVLDARHVAGGASGRNGGLLLTGIAHSYKAACDHYGRATTRDLWSLTVRNREAMIDWATKLGTPVRRCGSAIVACSPAEAAELEESAALMNADGFAAEWHANDPLGRGFLGGITNPADGAIQPGLLTAALMQTSGARLREACEVYGLESTADGVLVRVRGGDVLAQRVVLATNAWTPLFMPEFSDQIVPGRGQILATAPVAPFLHPAAYCDYGFVYFQQTPEGRLVLGGYRNLAFEAERTYADQVTADIQLALETFLAQYFPEVRNVPIERRWSGTMAFTPDGLPLVGRLRRDERIAFAVGFNGHGLGLGIMAAEELVSALQGETTPAMFSATGRMPDAA